MKYTLNTSLMDLVLGIAFSSSLFIKSPRSVVTLYFQFVSASTTSPAAAAKTFASHVKTVFTKPYIFGTKNI